MKHLHLAPAQAPHLVALAQKLAPDPLFVRYRLSAEALSASWTQALGRGDGLIVALLGDEPRGLAWFSRDGAFGRGAYLRLLAIVQDAQAQGTGKRLLAAFETACLPARGGWCLLCSDFNVKAQRFYQAQGYHQVGSLPGFVLPDVAEVLFYKPALASGPQS